MILGDTSAWIEYDRATPVDRRATDLIAHDGRLTATEPVVMEVVAGARTEVSETQLRRLLARFRLQPPAPATDLDGTRSAQAAGRRGVGVTPRRMLACLVRAVAWRRGATLLAQDIDLRWMADVVGIAVDDASA